MRVMITGGGTGGHTLPALAIIEELRRRDPQLFLQWVGRKDSIEERVSDANDVSFRSVPIEGWPRRRWLRRPWVATKLVLGVLRAVLFLRKFQPQVVVGVGGYVSLPAMWAAQRVGVPTVLHEQNKRLGMANRLLAPRAARIYLSYKDTIGEYHPERASVTGNPVRIGFLRPLPIPEARSVMQLKPGVPAVLVSGGSQGAYSINQAMADAVLRFNSEEVQFIWMTGKGFFQEAERVAATARAHVKVFDFIHDMPTATTAADLVVARAGASTTAELAALAKPAILIPYPYAAEDHQRQNAEVFEKTGAAIVLPDAQCSGNTLTAMLKELLSDKIQRTNLGIGIAKHAMPMAAETITEDIMALVFGERARDT